MEFNLSTFTLEIINFLVLVWILQRLFYKPVRAIIKRRKQQIDQTLADAVRMRQEADELQNSYENRLLQWEKEKQFAMSQLHQQLETEKQQKLLILQEELEQQRNKSQSAQKRQQQELQRHQQTLALQNGSRFAALLLRQAAGPELENRLVQLMFEQLQQLPEAGQQLLDSKTTLDISISISSVYPLSDAHRQQLEQKFTTLIDKTLHFQYSQNPELIAGLKIDIGAWALHVNIQHELIGFAEFCDDF